MTSIGTWLWGTSQLDDAIDKATSDLLPTDTEDIALNLEICDQIRSKSVSAKDAMRALKRRLNHKNPNVQLLALGLTDICIKNGGDHFLTEVASREFMDNLVSILKIPILNIDVKNKLLRLIQNWAVAFEGKTSLNYVGQVYKTLKNEGFKFPPQDMAVANSAMVDTQTAPEWIDSDVCLRCRTPFSFTNRKHHCRNCGQVFDQQCSSKTMPLPHFGITQEVRVCDGCYSKLSKRGEKSGHRHSASAHTSRHRSARELADAELQRAIQLSLEEAGFISPSSRPGYVPYQPSPPTWQPSEPPVVDRTTYPSDRKSPAQEEEDDPDLKAAIEASLREANAPKPSAPVETPRTEEPVYDGPGYSQSYPPASTPMPSVPKLPNYDLEPLESDAILTFSQTVEQVQTQGGRDVSRYPAVNELYDKANGLRPKLAMSLDDTGRKEQMLSEMHDKLSQAVKLYDQLLTEQVTHPTWRSPQPTPASPYAQTANASYTQWAPSQLPTTSYPQTADPSMVDHGTRPPNSPHTSYSHQYPASPRTEPAQYAPNPNGHIHQTWFEQHSQFADASHQTQWGQQPAQQMAQPPTQSQPPVPISHYVSSPPSHPAVAPSSGPTYQATPAVPTPPPQSPPPQQQQAYPKAQSPPLARHNTIAYAASPQPSVPNHYLSRSNTVAHAPQPSLPSFPVVPTSAPQTFSMYGPSIPTSPPAERKEALLIDL